MSCHLWVNRLYSVSKGSDHGWHVSRGLSRRCTHVKGVITLLSPWFLDFHGTMWCAGCRYPKPRSILSTRHLFIAPVVNFHGGIVLEKDHHAHALLRLDCEDSDA